VMTGVGLQGLASRYLWASHTWKFNKREGIQEKLKCKARMAAVST
jgi:hypothetical protein